jgi:hypothetical protein
VEVVFMMLKEFKNRELIDLKPLGGKPSDEILKT